MFIIFLSLNVTLFVERSFVFKATDLEMSPVTVRTVGMAGSGINRNFTNVWLKDVTDMRVDHRNKISLI